MPIVGLTVDEAGENLIELPVTTVIGCGVGPSGASNHPDKTGRWLFKRRGPKARQWVIDDDLMRQHYPAWDVCSKHEVTETCPQCCTVVRVMLLQDPLALQNGQYDLDNVLHTGLIWWGQSGWKCKGNGVVAERRTKEHPEGQEWKPCQLAGCPDYGETCSDSGDLYCVLADTSLTLGGICRIHTSSRKSIKQLHGALAQIAHYTGGKLARIVVSVKVQMEATRFWDKKEQAYRPTTAPFLSITDDLKKLVENSLEANKRFGASTALLTGGRIIVVDPDEERAQDIPAEFPAGGGEQKQLPPQQESCNVAPDEKKNEIKVEEKKPEAEGGGKPEVNTVEEKEPERKKPTPIRRDVYTGIVTKTVERKHKGKGYCEFTLEAAGKKVLIMSNERAVTAQIIAALEKPGHRLGPYAVNIVCDVFLDSQQKEQLVAVSVELAKVQPEEEQKSEETSTDGEQSPFWWAN